jgi:enoyl-[acyl-carrier protein] reductase I
MIEHCQQNTPIAAPITAREVGTASAFLASPLASGVTGHVLYVDKGYHAMGAPAQFAEIAKQST